METNTIVGISISPIERRTVSSLRGLLNDEAIEKLAEEPTVDLTKGD